AVLFGACLEVRRGAEIVGPRVDDLPAKKPANAPLRTMPNPLPAHVNLILAAGSKNKPNVTLHHSAPPDHREAPPPGQSPAPELRSLEAAGVKMEDASAAIRRIAEAGHLNFQGDREQKLGVDLRHVDPSYEDDPRPSLVNGMELTVSSPVLVEKMKHGSP